MYLNDDSYIGILGIAICIVVIAVLFCMYPISTVIALGFWLRPGLLEIWKIIFNKIHS